MINFFKAPEAKPGITQSNNTSHGKLRVASLNKAMIDKTAAEPNNPRQFFDPLYTGYYRSLDGESIFLFPSADDEMMYCGYDSSEYY